MSEVDEIGEALREAVSRTCADCALENVSQAENCARCGQPLPPLEEERSVSFREGALVYHKTTLEESWNFKVLRLAVESLTSQSIGIEEYREHVGRILDAAREFLEALEDQAERYDALDEASQSILGRTLVHYQTFVSACERMMEAQADNLSPAVDGLGLVCQSLLGLDRVEDEATDRLRELSEQVAERPEEEVVADEEEPQE